MAVSLVLVLAVFVICVYAIWRNQSRRYNEPPIYPGAWPLLGHVPSLIGGKKMWNFLRQVAVYLPSKEGISYILIGPKKVYVICDLDDTLLVSNQCLDKSVYYSFGDTWLGKSLIISESSIWKKDRKMIMPAFHHDVMEGFLDTFNKQARLIVEEMSAEVNNGSFEHLKYLNEYSMDTLCKTVLGIEISEKNKYMHMTETIMSMMVKRFLNPFFHSDTVYSWSNLKNSEDKYTSYIHSIADEMIEKKRSERKSNPQNNFGIKSNFLELLLDMSTRETMTDKQLRDQLNLMIVAGYDTSSITTSTALILIGSHKNVQDKIYKEITEILGDTNRDITLSDLDKMVYLEAVLKETLRLYPTAPVVLREIKEDVKLANYTLYAGTSCILFLAGLNMHPKLWGEDVQHFKPERWLPPSTVSDHPAAFAGFSIGRRNCIGKYYAMMSMKIVLSYIIRNYVINADLTNIEFNFKLLNTPEPSNRISLQKRI